MECLPLLPTLIYSCKRRQTRDGSSVYGTRVLKPCQCSGTRRNRRHYGTTFTSGSRVSAQTGSSHVRQPCLLELYTPKRGVPATLPSDNCNHLVAKNCKDIAFSVGNGKFAILSQRHWRRRTRQPTDVADAGNIRS